MNDGYFEKNQKLLLSLVNTEGGRYLLGIKEKEKVVKVSPSSYHLLDGVEGKNLVIRGKFYCYEAIAKTLLPVHRF